MQPSTLPASRWAEWRLTHPAEATGSGGGEAGMCDLLDAAEALEPGGRRRPSTPPETVETTYQKLT